MSEQKPYNESEIIRLWDDWVAKEKAVRTYPPQQGEIENLKQQLAVERQKVDLLHDAAIIARVALTRSHPTGQHEAYNYITRILDQVAALEQQT